MVLTNNQVTLILTDKNNHDHLIHLYTQSSNYVLISLAFSKTQVYCISPE